MENIDVAMGFTLNTPLDTALTLPSQHTMTVSVLPAVAEMVTTVRLGRPQFGQKCYAALGTWVENNGYQIAGQGREIFIVPPLPGKEDETVVEIKSPCHPFTLSPSQYLEERNE